MTRQVPPPRSIHFDVGQITLHGYGAADRDRFESALRIALAELAASQAGLAEPPRDGNRFIPRLDAGAIPAGASPERAARVIAARVLGAVASPGQAASPAGTVGPSGTASPGGGHHV